MLHCKDLCGSMLLVFCRILKRETGFEVVTQTVAKLEQASDGICEKSRNFIKSQIFMTNGCLTVKSECICGSEGSILFLNSLRSKEEGVGGSCRVSKKYNFVCLFTANFQNASPLLWSLYGVIYKWWCLNSAWVFDCLTPNSVSKVCQCLKVFGVSLHSQQKLPTLSALADEW